MAAIEITKGPEESRADQITYKERSFDSGAARCLICFEGDCGANGTSTSNSDGGRREMMGTHELKKCGHVICTSCTIQLCHVAMEQKVYRIKCPSMECDEHFDVWALVEFLKDIDEKELAYSLEQSAIIDMEGVIYCANPLCAEPFVYDGDSSPSTVLVVCAKCRVENCMRCNELWHEGTTCAAKNATSDGNGNGRSGLSRLEKDKKLASCPRCKVRVERVSGCNRMRCVCGQIFCYNCGTQYIPGSHPHVYVPICDCLEEVDNVGRRIIRGVRRLCTPSCFKNPFAENEKQVVARRIRCQL